MDESLSFFLSIAPTLLAAVPVTLTLTFFSALIGNSLAVPVAVASLSPNPLLRYPSAFYIFVMRGTPLLAQTYLIYYGLGELLPGTWVQKSFLWPYLRDGFWYAIFAFSLNTAGYTGEILRGAIMAVPKGEIEAARAYGFSKGLIFWRVTLPRAIQICLPTMTGETILLLKATSLASLITVWEVMGTARQIQKVTFRVYEPLIAAGLLYIIMVFVLTRLMIIVERRINRHRLAPV
ncbi:MAG: ABC transporter permease subunit [Alphaproteobacteria bacterium]|nr:ABC transporter permease subunit [Alphaproteobacteria bacterium]